jgi:NADPH-dependent curcumin reductase CurA
VNTIEFDINFMNFEDPEVLERLTGPDFEKHMKATYGFDHVIKTKTTKIENNVTKTVPDGFKIIKHCAESEFR